MKPPGTSNAIRWCRCVMGKNRKRKWSFKSRVKLQSEPDLQNIVQFYVFESPVPGASVKGKTFEDLGWKDHAYATLHAKMRESSGLFEKGHWVDCPIKNVEQELEKLDRLNGYDCSFEFAVHCKRSDLNKTEALFYLIRNALAHGGFRISTDGPEHYLVLENRADGELKGRAVIKMDALLKWAKLLSKKRKGD